MTHSLQPYSSIQQTAPDLFCVEGEWYDTPFRRRMTVVRLRDGSLVVHSSIQMEEKDFAQLDALGPVKVIIVPNIFHTSEAQIFAERYPEAQVYVPEAIRKKYSRSGRVTGALESDWPTALQSELACVSLQNCMAGESVFIHHASQTLILTDLAFNMVESDFKNSVEKLLIGRWNGILEGFGPSRLTRYVLARNRESVSKFLKKISAYEFSRVVMSHGQVVTSDGKARFLAGYRRVYGNSIC